MRSFRDRPLARTVPVFLVGVWYGTSACDGLLIPGVLFAAGISVLLSRVPSRYTWLPYGWRWLIGLAVFVSLFSGGVLIGSLYDERISSFHLTHQDAEAFSGIILENPKHKGDFLRTIVKVDLLRADGKWTAANGRVLVYFPAGSVADSSCSGKRICVNKSWQPVASVLFPGQFDFKNWLELKQVHRMVRLRKGEWVIQDVPVAASLKTRMEKWQQRLVGCYRDAGFSGNELGVVSALVLGEDGEVDPALLHAFAASGTLHVLSVSGMHVALVHGAVERLLALLFRRRRNRWPRLVVSFLVLWMYALLTGFSPAVRRAAAMLSLVLLGKAVNRSVDTWNVLAGSLLVLVAMQPYVLRESGFQLSYAAVAGIIGFHPWLRSRTSDLGRAGEAVFTSVSVAISAQWFTFPLGLYHFHRFPNYFLPANLIIIPWSTVLLFGGIVLLLLEPLPMLFRPVGESLENLTGALNRTVLFFDRLPNAETTGVWISGIECLLLSGSVVLVTAFLVLRRNEFLFASLLFLLAFFASQLHYSMENRDRLQLVDWHSRQQSTTVVYGHRSFTRYARNDEATDSKTAARVSDGLDALRIPGSSRITSVEGTSRDAVEHGFPVIFLRYMVLLPDTVVSLKRFNDP